MSEQIHDDRCNKCNSEVIGNFCSTCGTAQKLNRINGAFILSEIASIFNFEKGILFTIKELLIRPGVNIRKFIQEDRKRLVKPLSFIILSSLIYTLAKQWLDFDGGYINLSDLGLEDSAITPIMTWVSANYGIVNILMANFIAIWLKIFFRKYNYNYFEILILLYFVLGIQMLMFSFFGIAEIITKIKFMDNGGAILTIVYVCRAIGLFFERKKVSNYIKALFSYFLGMLSFVFITVACVYVIHLLAK